MPRKDGTPTWREKFQAGIKRGFKYDGCTASPDFDFGICCKHHDYDYQDLSKTRLQADNDLFRCMYHRSLIGKCLAPLYWLAVRLFAANHYANRQAQTALKNSPEIRQTVV